MNLFKSINKQLDSFKVHPVLFILILGVMFLSVAVLHEFGHAACCVFGGGEFVGFDWLKPETVCLVGNPLLFCSGGIIANAILGLLVFSKNKWLRLFGVVNLANIFLLFLFAGEPNSDIACVLEALK